MQGQFVNDVALAFLDDVRPLVRKAAAETVRLLNANQKKEMKTAAGGLSHNVNQSNKR